MIHSYFFDTYALIEVLKGNQKYQRFFEAEFVITKLNAIELHYHSLKLAGEEKARSDLEKVWGNIRAFGEEIIAEANKLRLKYKSRDLSTADCIGYVYAVKNGIPFTTGDKEFEGLPNVEFVRK